MTDRDLPLLVVVTGPPASGKTTIARALAAELTLLLFAKDDFKEALFDELGTGYRAWSRRLGRAVFALLMAVAERDLAAGRSLMLEANFVRGESEPRFAPLPPHRLVQVHCSAPADVLLGRFRARDRHAGHLDASTIPTSRRRSTSGAMTRLLSRASCSSSTRAGTSTWRRS
jgi:predicted kinase